MREIFDFIENELKNGKPVVSAVILSSKGSTPRSIGSRMAIASDKSFCGSVGGGPTEAAVQWEAQQVFQNEKSNILNFDLTGTNSHEDGMICGGKMEILLEYISPTVENSQLIKRLRKRYEKCEDSILITALKREDEGIQIIFKGLSEQTLPERISKILNSKAAKRSISAKRPFFTEEDKFTVLMEPIIIPGKVVIIGAGHVGMCTACLATQVGFRTFVLDDRKDQLTRERLPSIEEIIAIDNYDSCIQLTEITPDTNIIILTRGHFYDKTVLAQALTTSAGYIGMIGSTRKRDTIYEKLLDEGFSHEDLKRVVCPIGLDIGAVTPEELAVSIVGQLIAYKAGKMS